ncbi:DUF2975 domain-containing protein [Geodermatophilus dictyosporus]|nr:DUF2975 domain-containing protein [Geodermatophilus dictyosporus]
MTARRAVLPLRVLLVLLFGLLVVLETVSLPGQFAHLAEQRPDLAHLRWPLTAVTVFWVVCAQVVVVATGKLLTLFEQDRVFSDGASRWVDLVLWAIGAAWAVLVVVAAAVVPTADDPALPLLLLLAVAGVGALGLLVVVVRALLRQATTLRTDLDAVI